MCVRGGGCVIQGGEREPDFGVFHECIAAVLSNGSHSMLPLQKTTTTKLWWSWFVMVSRRKDGTMVPLICPHLHPMATLGGETLV